MVSENNFVPGDDKVIKYCFEGFIEVNTGECGTL